MVDNVTNKQEDPKMDRTYHHSDKLIEILQKRIRELELENQRLRSTVNNQQALFGRGFL